MEASERIVYSREFLLGLQFSPLSLNPKAEEILCQEYENEGLFDPGRWTAKKDQAPSTQRKEMAADYFKCWNDGDILRPQRKSFTSGCQMTTLNENSSSPTSICSDTKERPRSQAAGERPDKKVGSGRIFVERSDSRPDGRSDGRPDMPGGVYQPRDKQVRHKSNADKRADWRSHGDAGDECELGYRGRDYHRESRDYRNGNYRFKDGEKRQYPQDEQPEWFTEEVTMNDHIELKGFDDKYRKNRSKNKKASEPNQENETVNKSSSSNDHPKETPTDRDDGGRAPSADLDPSVNRQQGFKDSFDFNSFLNLSDDSETQHQPDKMSSRFAKWFKVEHEGCQTGLPQTSNKDPAVDSHFASIMQGLLSSAEDFSRNSDTVDFPHSPNGGYDIFDVILKSGSSSAPQKGKANSKPSEKPDNSGMPAILSKLFGTASASDRHDPAYNTNSLPTEYKTVEELEAGYLPSKKPEKPVYNSDSQHHHPPPLKAETPSAGNQTANLLNMLQGSDLTAFDKLVLDMRSAGELNRSMPKMPDIPVEIRDQFKKSQPNSLASHVGERKEFEPPNIFSQLSAPPPAPQQFPPAASGMQASFLPSHLVPQRTTQTNAAESLTSMVHPTGIQNNTSSANHTPSMGLHTNAALANHAGHIPAMQPPINQLLHQTIQQQQRQKLPSPIMFGSQPPVHIVAPSPIHPMAAPSMPQMMPSAYHGGNIPVIPSHIEQVNGGYMNQLRASSSALYTQPAPVMSMAFTPTSVIRKLANEKADERQRQSENHQLTNLLNSLNSSGSLQQQVPSHRVQHQPQSIPHGFSNAMRPIVKSNGPLPEHLIPNMVQGQYRDHKASVMQHQIKQPNAQHQQPPYQIPYPSANGLYSYPKLAHPEYNNQDSLSSMLSQQMIQPLNSPGTHKMDVLQKRLSAESIFKWFPLKDMNNQLITADIPRHAPMLTLDDIEN